MKRKTRALLFLLGTAAVLVGAGGFGYWQVTGSERGCASCHEIQTSQDVWAESHHREVACVECHGTAFSNGVHGLRENLRRVGSHFRDEHPVDIRLTEDQVVGMVDRCRRCHEGEFADWLASGHSLTYSDVFLNEKHNKVEQPMDDCLRCHGMFYEGSVSDLVAPLDNHGPWRLLKDTHAKRPAIPCLGCHEIHFKGNPAVRPDYSNPTGIASQRESRVPRAAFYDRNEKAHFVAANLGVPTVVHQGRALSAAQDERQRVCVQCHAPNALRIAGSSDDRTPRGVHEGLSCQACHADHSLETRQSCKECHPRLSNCGLDVEKMDTTFKSPQSPHNVHWVGCADCHTKGVPPRKPRQ